MLITPSFKKSLIVEQFQENYLNHSATTTLTVQTRSKAQEMRSQRDLLPRLPNEEPYPSQELYLFFFFSFYFSSLFLKPI